VVKKKRKRTTVLFGGEKKETSEPYSRPTVKGKETKSVEKKRRGGGVFTFEMKGASGSKRRTAEEMQPRGVDKGNRHLGGGGGREEAVAVLLPREKKDEFSKRLQREKRGPSTSQERGEGRVEVLLLDT